MRNGSKPVAVILDCTKAFDLARHDILFETLLGKIPAIVVRVLSFSYKEQLGWIKWGRNLTSSPFGISNGTRQGSVASPSLRAAYLDPLSTKLRALGVGCHI